MCTSPPFPALVAASVAKRRRAPQLATAGGPFASPSLEPPGASRPFEATPRARQESTGSRVGMKTGAGRQRESRAAAEAVRCSVEELVRADLGAGRDPVAVSGASDSSETGVATPLSRAISSHPALLRGQNTDLVVSEWTNDPPRSQKRR